MPRSPWPDPPARAVERPGRAGWAEAAAGGVAKDDSALEVRDPRDKQEEQGGRARPKRSRILLIRKTS